MKAIVYCYKFKDGAEFFLLNIGFSDDDLQKLSEIHGNYEISFKKAKLVPDKTCI